MNRDSNHFGNWLRREIENTGLTFRAFARKTLFPAVTIHRWMSSQCPPIQGCNIVRLARALHIDREVIDERLRLAAEAQEANAAA